MLQRKKPPGSQCSQTGNPSRADRVLASSPGLFCPVHLLETSIQGGSSCCAISLSSRALPNFCLSPTSQYLQPKTQRWVRDLETSLRYRQKHTQKSCIYTLAGLTKEPSGSASTSDTHKWCTEDLPALASFQPIFIWHQFSWCKSSAPGPM